MQRAWALGCAVVLLSATGRAKETTEAPSAPATDAVEVDADANEDSPRVVGPRAVPACSDPKLCELSDGELERRYHSISDGGPIAMVISGSILGSIALPTFLVSGAISLFCANSTSGMNCGPVEVTAAVSGVSTLVFGGMLIGGIVLLDLNGEERSDIKNELGRRGRTISSLELTLQPVAFGSGLALGGTF